MRYDPFYRTWQLHAGLDLSAPSGAPIRAAAAGQVMRAGWNSGYGNYTCIYHGTYEGKGFATCYAHQSQVLVAVGQQVRQGDVIGRVGTTGASTGNHLHFEVRLDGVPVDPAPWLFG
jgi:murein DD-endopeptidase MepM/ murein hydrolase activator NlpD